MFHAHDAAHTNKFVQKVFRSIFRDRRKGYVMRKRMGMLRELLEALYKTRPDTASGVHDDEEPNLVWLGHFIYVLSAIFFLWAIHAVYDWVVSAN